MDTKFGHFDHFFGDARGYFLEKHFRQNRFCVLISVNIWSVNFHFVSIFCCFFPKIFSTMTRASGEGFLFFGFIFG
jgi:hypothetical protein